MANTSMIAGCTSNPFLPFISRDLGRSCDSNRAVQCAFEAHPIEICFFVSYDEERVRVEILTDGRRLDLGWRAHHFLLLTLARRRRADAATGVPEATWGWVDTREFEHDPSLTRERINLAAHRVRRQLAEYSISDDSVFERRGTRLRLTSSRVSIARV
ncbi:MAG TPA: hypothetical protein VHV30_17945 [Polyangiaceae bacterium]|jgi:hypothetical protein|nr:hypothetical protein [Polyangiaceae bacterium]